MNPELEARIRRFERLGGVDLSRCDFEDPLPREVRVGIAEMPKGIRFRCPLCSRIEVNNQDMEPMCTGPSWTDDHVPEVMIRVQ